MSTRLALRSKTVVALAAAAAAVLTAATVGSASPASPWIVFAAAPQQGTHNEQLFRVRADGTGLRQLTSKPWAITAPSFAPDGKRIAFEQFGRGVYVMNLDGSGVRRLTSGRFDQFPVWSPNGKQITFLRGHDLALMNANGTRQRVLPRNPGPAGRPSWTPNGKAIVFPAYHEVAPLGAALYRRVLATARVSKLPVRIHAENSVSVPELSPKGGVVAYVDTRPSPPGCQRNACAVFALYEATLGGHVRKLVDDATAPGWSPDGKTIAFARDGVLLLQPLAGGPARTIPTGTNPVVGDAPPAWQPRR